MSRCLPRASTRSIVRPRIVRVSSARAILEKTDSKRVTVRPASLSLSVRAARKIVSPSGISKSQIPDPKLGSNPNLTTLEIWGLGFGLWDLFVDSIVAVDLGEGAVGVDLAVVNGTEVLAANDIAASDRFLALSGRVLAAHSIVVPAVALGLQPLSLNCLILIVGRPDAVV